MSVRLLDGSQRDKESVQTAQVCHHLSAGRVQRREAQARLVGHQVGSLHLQDGFISGQSCQVSVAHHLVVHSGLHTHTHTGNRWVCLCTHWVYEHVRSVFTVMPAAGEPGVLRPPEEGRLTGVTCPSTCDIITQSGSFMFISTQQKCVCVCQWWITFCMTGENLPPVGFQPAAHKQRESLFFWWSLTVTRLSLRIQTDSWRFTSAAEDILKDEVTQRLWSFMFLQLLTNKQQKQSICGTTFSGGLRINWVNSSWRWRHITFLYRDLWFKDTHDVGYNSAESQKYEALIITITSIDRV